MTCLVGCSTLTEVSIYPMQIISGQAMADMAIGQYRSAIAKLDLIIFLNANDRADVWLRGICYCYLTEFDKAITDFSKAISLAHYSGEITQSLNYRGYCYLQAGEIEKALADCNRGMSIGPSFSTYYVLALISIKQGNFKAAAEFCTQGILAFKLPNHQKYFQAPFYEARAFSFNKLGNYRQALADINQAIAYNIAKRAMPTPEVHSIELALRMADCYIPISLNDLAIRASVHLNLKQTDKAIDDCNLAIGENPKDAEAYHYRAIAYKTLGKHQLAKIDDAKAADLGYKHS